LCIIDDITKRKQAQQKLFDDREQLKSLASQLSLTEEHERHRLATELHDHIGQSLVISKIKLDQLRKCESGGSMTEALTEVSRCLGQVIADTRTLTFDLSYPILYELGFEAAVAEWLTEQIEEKHGIKARFEDDGRSKPLDDDIQALLFRNVRELLINVVKHAHADYVKVSVRRADPHICVRVEDNGIGFDPLEVAAMAAKRAEFGLFSIRERLEQLGGYIEIESEPDRGTKITMLAPLKRETLNDGAET
jgi:signal transduction histidine kinase